MSGPPEHYDAETCANFLRELGASGERILPIAEAALALASFERPRVGPARYREHLKLLARDVGGHPAAAGDVAERAGALNEIILLKYGYTGDALTYDDLQNANLMRVVDRRKGLPVALGILYMHAARAQGWETVGLAELWREAGLLHARLGNMRSAAAALEQVVLRTSDGMARHQAAALLQQLRSKLN